MTYQLDGTLHKIYMLTFRFADRQRAENAYSDLAWYINTGRASTPFCRKLVSLKGNQRMALLRRMVKTEEYTTKAHIAAALEYMGF